MPTKKEPRRASPSVSTDAKKAKQTSTTGIVSKAKDAAKSPAARAPAQADSARKDVAPTLDRPETIQDAANAQQPATKASPKPSPARVAAPAAKASVSDKATPRNKAAAAAPSTGVHRKQPEPSALDSVSVPLTRIVANVDVGYGNTLFLRGEGGGLSWEIGVAMDCEGANNWSWTADSSDERITFKFLINDQVWSAGDDLTVGQGQTSISTPEF